MPVSLPKFDIQTYTSAASLPPFVWDFFASHQRHTNVLYPVAKKFRQDERDGISCPPGTLWITCSTAHFAHRSTLDFILSCTPGPQGLYPIFICSTKPSNKLSEDYMRPRVEELVLTLDASVPRSRVYSVFALKPISECFAYLWKKHTGVSLDENSVYYSAKLTHCSRASLCKRRSTQHSDCSYIMRPAVEDDIHAAAILCHGFAAVSIPFVLSLEGAIQEATYLVRNKQLWVHQVIRPNEPPRIACIVALTRSSESVAGITKVYTDPTWRNRGCAERLVKTVCNHLLKEHESVVLYVAHDNPAAAKVYHKVGFRGLLSDNAEDGVEDWLELGFDRKVVELGHW